MVPTNEQPLFPYTTFSDWFCNRLGCVVCEVRIECLYQTARFSTTLTAVIRFTADSTWSWAPNWT